MFILDIAFVTLLKIRIDVHRFITLTPLDAVFMAAIDFSGFGSKFSRLEIEQRIYCKSAASK